MDVERAGGRGANQLRPIDCSRDVLSRAHGSASCSHGETRVLAAVFGPKAGTKKNENPEKACIEVIWKAKTGQIGKIEKEFEMILKRTLQNICLLTVHPNTTTSIIVQVVHDDGSVSFLGFICKLLPCAIHATCAALVDGGIPLKSLAVSLCCCLTDSGQILLDPSKLEEQPLPKELHKSNPILLQVSKTIKEASLRLLDAFVDSVFHFIDQPLLPSQVTLLANGIHKSNFAPVEEIGEAVDVTESINGRIPDGFLAGVYIRNGPNPLFGGLESTISVFGKSSHTWIEGEGMLHVLYFSKNGDGRLEISYRNRHVETDTFKQEKARKKPAFLPAIEGDSLAVLSAYLLNYLRFGFVNKYLSNTSVFEHSGKLYSSAENHIPQEMDIFTLETGRNWDVNGSWNRPFTSHPKRDPDTGELVIMGIHPEKPYFELGVVSDLGLDRCCLCHEIGITTRYNVIMDFPLTIDINRLIRGGPLIKYNEEDYAWISIMPRYGEADSLKWFNVEPGCTFHIINCHEQDDEVVVLACRARDSMIPGPDFGLNKHEWFSKGLEQTGADAQFLLRVYDWRLNLLTGEVVAEKNLTGTDYSMEFPIINDKYIGKICKYAYTQVKVEHHKLPGNTFCSGIAFVAKTGGGDEDDGWIVAYVHNEDRNTSHVYVVDAKNFCNEPVAVINLPRRVPYGFHGAFPLSKELHKSNLILLQLSKTIKEASLRLLDAFVDSVFHFIDQPLPPSQSNFAPVEEIGEAVDVAESINGRIPDGFPAGVYIRNGPNPLFGGLKSTNSIFGKSSHTWVEGEGMLHVLYVSKHGDGRWEIFYRNRHVETDTFKLEKSRKKPAFLPAAEGDSLAVLSAYLLNYLRFGFVNKYVNNTSVFEHSGKLYSAAENHIPQEMDIFTLETGRNWDVNGSWNRPFTSHPKRDPYTGELVIMGIHPEKPYFELGVISVDGNRLLHKVDLGLDRCCLCHEIGITTRYNVIMDFPLTIDLSTDKRRTYNGEEYARIGIMPRYGEADSLKWFDVEPGCTFHIINCHEHDDEVVVLACRARIEQTGADAQFLSRVYEWRLNLLKGEVVAEKNLTGTDYSMEFPIINDKYVGKMCKYGYTQVVCSKASSTAGTPKYGGLAKLHLQEREQCNGLIKVEHHKLPRNTFCTGAAFVAKRGGADEDDGWIIAYVHDEDRNISHVYVVDAKNFCNEPVAVIDLPRRVPYGFHGAFVPFDYEETTT
ncbi:hypothetical protein SASPL_150896 [Salvia splendens]|uniref:Exoribonuclease phosphorolytic domain-containing protein n=1 Tax=Salvia splendens TaxID=180675 RepID=A0A8X8Z2V9_SALSN|nr:hypothetical protein SASPL_150896 [Salvia splendens]